MATIVVSTSNSPYKQWLVGRLVVLCDVAAAAWGMDQGWAMSIVKKKDS